MFLKIRSLAFMLLLVMLFSGVVCGENLLIGGINQDPKAIKDNTDYAKQISAMYVPTYTGSEGDNVNEVRKAALDHPTVQNGLSLEELGAKGPKHYDTIVAYSGGTASAVTALDKQGVTCDTLILISPMAAGVPDSYLVGTAAAGAVVGTVTGAASAVGAAAAFPPAAPVTAPAAALGGFAAGAAGTGLVASGPAAIIARNNYNAQIDRILKSGAVKNIVVIQSPEDNLPGGYIYQYQFPEGKPQITVHNLDLKSTGKETVHELIFDYAKANLKADNNGKIYYAPSQPTLNQESNAFKKPNLAALLKPGLLSPLLVSPSMSSSAMSSSQYSEVSNALNTAGNPSTTSSGKSLIYDNFYSIGGCAPDAEAGHTLVVPKYLPDPTTGTISGVLNTYGADWIYLPGMDKFYDQSYLNWVKAWVADSGSTTPNVAGVGPL